MNGDGIAVTDTSFECALIATACAYDSQVRVSGKGHVLAELLGLVRDVGRVGGERVEGRWVTYRRGEGKRRPLQDLVIPR